MYAESRYIARARGTAYSLRYLVYGRCVSSGDADFYLFIYLFIPGGQEGCGGRCSWAVVYPAILASDELNR